MLFIFTTPVLIRHLWQPKKVFFPALVSNMGCSIGRGIRTFMWHLYSKF